MNVALLTHFYPPEPCAAANRVASLSRALIEAGHDVTVITNVPSFPQGRFAAPVHFPLREETVDGVRVIRLWSFLPQQLPGKRLIHWVTAALAASAYIVFTRKRYDVLVASLPPITLALPALAGAHIRRTRLIADIRDVFPDIAIAMGAWRENGVAARVCEWFARALYRRADLTVAVTPTAIEQIARRQPDRSRLMLAPNAADGVAENVVPEKRDGAFVAVYAGNLGVATDVDIFADAAAELRDSPITIEIIGDGAERARLEERIRAERLTNIRMRGSLTRSDAMAAIASADVSIVPLRKGIEESVPTKIYDGAALGVPVIVAAAGEAARVGAELAAQCVPPGDAAALATALRELAALPAADRRERGLEGRRRMRERAGRDDVMRGVAERIAALCAHDVGHHSDQREHQPRVFVGEQVDR